MKKIHPLTTAGIGLGLASLACLISGFPLVACGLATAGYFFTLPEIPKYSSWFQYLMFPLQGLLIGLALDSGHPGFPTMSVAMTLVPFSTLPRLIFYNKMLHTKLLWLEPLLMVFALGMYFYFNITQHRDWPSWVFPVLPVVFNFYLFQGFILDGLVYNRVAKQSKIVNVGSTAPDFELMDQFGQPVKLSSFKEKRAVLLFFVRGDWCPACHMMLRSYERNREKFQEKNVLLLAVGPDDFDVNRDMAERLGIDYRILADKKQSVAMQYGVHLDKDPVGSKLRTEYEAGHLMPASFLVGADGVIHYHSRADRAGELLHPELIFEVLNNLN